MNDRFAGTIVGGRYRLRHLLGIGGSAAIYEAEDITFGRTVAVKIPHENAGPNGVAAKRLLREARASGAVNHPNVCEISEVGTLPNGSPFIVMERLIGETLRDRMMKVPNEGGLGFAEIVDIMLQVLSGLGAAHERGIVHRDVKPENIFLWQRAGCAPLVKILDFGLVSTDQPAKEQLTDAGMVVGTTFYISPEQIRGVRDFDPRVDIYACGVVLYETTTGRRPFAATNTADLFEQILVGQPPNIRDLRPDTPAQLAGVIARAMALSPGGRYATAGAFQMALTTARLDRSAAWDQAAPAGPPREWEQPTLKKPAFTRKK